MSWRKYRVNRITRAAEALGVPKLKDLQEKLAKIAAVLIAVMGIGLNATIANAATLSSAKVALSDPQPYPGSGTAGTNVTYTVTGSSVTATALRCITATFVTTPSGSTAVPGLSASSATVDGASTLLTSSTGSWSTTDTANQVKYTNTTNVTAPSVTTGATFIMQAIQNGNTADTAYWVQFKTFSDSSCVTPIDNATVGFIYTSGSLLSLTVDQTLSFTVNTVGSAQSCDGTTTTAASTATTIPFGTVTAASNAVVCQDLTAATNATNGYTIFARYTAKPTNPLSQTIADHTGTNASPTAFSAAGTEAYGYSTNDASLGTGTANRFTSPAAEWAAMTTSNLEVAYESAGVTSTTYRIGHQVGVSLTTHPGTYTTTIIYTCTPVY